MKNPAMTTMFMRWSVMMAGVFLVLLVSCEEETQWPLPEGGTGPLVVEGMITNEAGPHRVVLSLPFASLNGQALPVSGAQVTVDDGERVWVFTESDTLPGTYLSPAALQGVLGRTYRLRIGWDGREYTASAHMVPVTPLEPMAWHPLPGVDTLYVLDPVESNIPAMTEVYADWSFLPGWQGLPDTLTHAFFRYYTLTTVDPNALFPPTQEEVAVPAGALLTRRKYSLAPGYEEYLRTLLSETAWRGSIFDVLAGNVHTNLSKGATGYFAVCTVTGERTVFRPE